MPPTSSTSGSDMRTITACIAFLAGLALLLAAVQFVMFPRHDRDELWPDYLALPGESANVLLFGTSLVHANVNPAVMWDETGARAYALSGSEQSLLTMGPYVEEALKTQRPELVVLDLHMLSVDNLELSENQKRSNLTMMPSGAPKIRAVTRAVPGSEWTRYFIPLEQFHSRWSELTRADFSPAKWRRNDPKLHLGYRRVDKTEPQQPSDETRPFDAARYRRNYALLSEAIGEAESAGAKVLLLVGPSARPAIHDRWLTALRRDLARDHPDADILDAARRVDDMGVDPEVDYYDHWHLNSVGAEKYSRWLAAYLADRYGIARGSGDVPEEPWSVEYERYRKAR